VSLLVLEDLHVAYGGIRALKGISITIEQGQIVTLVGANGAGKSTTLRAISGLIRPSQGKILLEGRSLIGVPPHQIVKLGVSHVPEGRIVFANLTVADNLELGAYLRKDRKGIEEDRRKVFTLFPRLKERERQSAGTLSGGEQQMLAIGRALMTTPKILLLDEPSLGLAPLLVQQIFQTIQEINRQGTVVLLVEQNANLALRMADRAYVLEAGQIVLEGTGAELLANDAVRRAYLGEA
jgi:branched-chain amino acid transport system ATP-binding protein